MFGVIGYIVFLILYILLIVFGVLEIIKNKKELRTWQENIFLFVIIVAYWANFFEKYVNGDPVGSHFAKIHPLANFSPTFFTLATIFNFVPKKYRNSFYALCEIMAPAMIFASMHNAVDVLINKNHGYTRVLFLI